MLHETVILFTPQPGNMLAKANKQSLLLSSEKHINNKKQASGWQDHTLWWRSALLSYKHIKIHTLSCIFFEP